MSERKLSEELRVTGERGEGYLVPTLLEWADRAAALEAEVAKAEEQRVYWMNTYRIASDERDTLAAENERLRASIAEAVKVCQAAYDNDAGVDPEDLYYILAPEGEGES